MNGEERNNFILNMIKTYTERHATYTSEKFLKHIDRDKVKNIVEGGSRDLLDALFLESYFENANVHSFECNSEAYEICKKNLKCGFGRIKLNDMAMSNEDGELSFFAFDHNKTEHHDIGVSSLYRHINQHDVPQKEIKVKGIRLDTYCKLNNIEQIDYLCLDVQGAEQVVLQGLGDLLDKVTYLVLEDDSMFYTGATPVKLHTLEKFELIDTICNDKLYVRR